MASLRASTLVRFLAFMLIGDADEGVEEIVVESGGVFCPTVTLPSLSVLGVLDPLATGEDVRASSSITPVIVLLVEALISLTVDELAEEEALLTPSCF